MILPPLPDSFEINFQEEANLWGWLSNRFPVKASLLLELGEVTDEKIGFVLMTREQIAGLVAKALGDHNEKLAQQLFDMTTPIQTRREYTRKSIRIGQGEYLELLYLKIINSTSFSNVLIDVLTKPMVRFIDEIDNEYGSVISDKIQRLRDLTLNWKEITPDPRSRNVEYTFIHLKEKPSPYLGSQENIHDKLIDLAKTMGYLQNLPHDMVDGPDPVYSELQNKWTESLEKELKTGINMEVSISKEESLSFRLFGYAKTEIDPVQLEQLYQNNEFDIDSYLEKYCEYPYGEELEKELKKYEQWRQKFSKIIEKYKTITLGYFVNLAKYQIDVKSDKEFEVNINQKFHDEIIEKFEKSREDILTELNQYEYRDFNDLVQKVMMEGNEEDYQQVKQLFTIGKAEENFNTISWYGKDLIQNEIAKYPVISYYCPNDLVPLLAVILKKYSLYNLIKSVSSKYNTLNTETS